jgi:hypothetical protein
MLRADTVVAAAGAERSIRWCAQGHIHAFRGKKSEGLSYPVSVELARSVALLHFVRLAAGGGFVHACHEFEVRYVRSMRVHSNR